MVGTLSEQKITGYFKNKSILITGSTGFLGKLLVEKILRVQSDVKKIYLPVRAADAAAAKQRVETEVVGNELFGLLREKHGDGFQSFIREKVIPLAGDVMREDFGIHSETLRELRLPQELDVIVNGAATTNFYERYDVALDVNVMGVKHMCNFAKKCPNLNVLLHVSTAYVAREKQGLVQERPFSYGQTLCDGPHLDIDAELNLARKLKKQMETNVDPSPKAERKAMKDLGLTRAQHFGWPNTYVFTKSMGEMIIGQLLQAEFPVVIVRPSIITSVQKDPLPGWIEGARSIHAVLLGYIKQNQTCFIGDPDLTADVIPGDMVVNAMMTTIVAHACSSMKKTSQSQSHHNPSLPAVYHVSTSVSHPAPCSVLYKAMLRYLKDHPIAGPNGRVMRIHKIRFIRSVFLFRLFMVLRYRIPLELLHILSILLCGLFGLKVLYNDLTRNYSYAMQLVDLYGPFALFKGSFDDNNLHRLRLTMDREPGGLFNFDTKTIDWDDYFYRIHVPGVMKLDK